MARALSENEKEIAKAIGKYLHDKYDWNVFGKSVCNKCKKTNFIHSSGKFCPQCGSKLEFVADEETCKEIYEAYCKGKLIDENCS